MQPMSTHPRSHARITTRHSSCRVRSIRFVLALFVSAISLGFEGAPNDQAKEYPVKAAMMGKFLKYVEWPSARFADDESPMIVGVFGKDPFQNSLERIFAGNSYRSHPYELRRVKVIEGVEQCHVLFIPATENALVAEIVERVKGRSVLLIGESNGFATQGGIINFYFEKKNPRFEVNPAAAKREKLKISSSLLKLARIVREKR